MMCQLWEDYCMLRIYTLQGVDHHRLLVRGQRVANACNYKAAVESETIQVTPILVVLVIAVIYVFYYWINIHDCSKYYYKSVK